MGRDDIEILLTETVYDSYLRVERHHLRHRRHDGDWTDVMTREIVERGHAVAVLPYDPARDEVVLIEQFRIGAMSRASPLGRSRSSPASSSPASPRRPSRAASPWKRPAARSARWSRPAVS